ncbi:hypothetical protein [Roseibium sp.]|uniref:hypothetical protein n=1 Tax=Roseibium sp. TaxID=1936156 RepID=UPI003267772C
MFDALTTPAGFHETLSPIIPWVLILFPAGTLMLCVFVIEARATARRTEHADFGELPNLPHPCTQRQILPGSAKIKNVVLALLCMGTLAAAIGIVVGRGLFLLTQGA